VPVLRVEPYEQHAVDVLTEGLNLPHVVARILSIRGVRSTAEAERFLYPSLEHLSDPFLLPDIETAVETVIEAIKTGLRVGLFGDYDADGITSTALMIDFLTKVGVEPVVYLPGRDEGYGLNLAAVERFHGKGVALLICLDCGSSNIAEIERARALGMDVLVIDHHEAPDPLPRARALVNPKRKDSRFPTRELAACGVTFFFLLALRRTLHRQGLLAQSINLKRELDLVAVGTVADMVPLTGDNRILARHGIEVMQKHRKPWLKSFYRQNVLFQKAIDTYALGFIIIPRINAAGRVSDPATALRFLISADQAEADGLLASLDAANRQRQNLEEDIIRQANEVIKDGRLSERHSLVLSREDWPIGVIGIAAQKLAESYRKPCIILTRVDGVWKGSARGVPGLDLHGTVGTLSSLLIRYGGHKFACGLSLAEENIVPFADAFEEAVRNCLLQTERTVTVDAIVDFEELTRELVEYLELLAPFGLGNPRPSFLLTPVSIAINNRSVSLLDQRNRTWRGYVPRKTDLPVGQDARVVVCPTLKEELGEKFIRFQIREFVTG
jgi:single-stranded-DNA-specific exonuclease